MLISGFPQQIVLADPGLAKGVTVTGTQTVSLWLNNDSHSFVSLHTGPQIVRPVAVGSSSEQAHINRAHRINIFQRKTYFHITNFFI